MDGIAPDGRPIVSVVFGMTFAVGRDGKCSARGYQFVDEALYMKARVSTRHTRPSLLMRDFDAYAWRNLTDVVVQGIARSDKPRKNMDVRLEVLGDAVAIDRTIAVTGDRYIDKGPTGLVLSEPEPFTEMFMSYERAYGGTDEMAEEKYEDPAAMNQIMTELGQEEFEEISLYSYPRNPAGKGYVLDEGSIVGTAWPNLEFPDDRLKLDRLVRPIDRWGDHPIPAAFDWLHPAWFPRIAFILDYPETHDGKVPAAERRLGLFDDAFDDKPVIERPKHPFANGAHPYLARSRLTGKESIRVTHMSPDGRDFGVRLPGLAPHVSIKLLDDARVKVPASLDLVFVETEAEQVTLLYRATLMTGRPDLPIYWSERTEYEISWQ